jgi:hypothetical protein
LANCRRSNAEVVQQFRIHGSNLALIHASPSAMRDTVIGS